MSELVISWVVSVCKILIAAGLINVWLVRFNRPTKYRGAGSHNMKEEFAVYGLPSWSLYVVGGFKLAIALCMILVLFVPSLMLSLGVPALGILSVLMLGAISMHVKVKDSLTRALPAVMMLLMASMILLNV